MGAALHLVTRHLPSSALVGHPRVLATSPCVHLWGGLDIPHPLVESQAHTLWEMKAQVGLEARRRSQALSPSVGFGETLQRTKLAFS